MPVLDQQRRSGGLLGDLPGRPGGIADGKARLLHGLGDLIETVDLQLGIFGHLTDRAAGLRGAAGHLGVFW